MVDLRDQQPAENTEAVSYDSSFFEALDEGVRRSAKVVAQPIVDIIQPRSTIDLGCGTGAWLAALTDRGVEDILGVDGPWVPRDQLVIPETLFRPHDLTKPFETDRRFDLALCLETAEHLPAEAAPVLVESLTRLAPVIVFSAAIPEQKGKGHVNEQWPDYWVKLFAERGYRCSTALRDLLWNDERVEFWYRQNLLCFAAPTHAPRLERLFDHKCSAVSAPLNVVHPELLLRDSENLRKYADYTAQLESQLRNTRLALRTAEANLESLENNLRSIRAVLWRIKNSLPYRIHTQARSAFRSVRNAIGRLWRKPSDPS
jgi:SAM-dependent methyltransferase